MLSKLWAGWSGLDDDPWHDPWAKMGCGRDTCIKAMEEKGWWVSNHIISALSLLVVRWWINLRARTKNKDEEVPCAQRWTDGRTKSRVVSFLLFTPFVMQMGHRFSLNMYADSFSFHSFSFVSLSIPVCPRHAREKREKKRKANKQTNQQINTHRQSKHTWKHTYKHASKQNKNNQQNCFLLL